MPSTGARPNEADLAAWLFHPEDRVVVEALTRFAGATTRDQWSAAIRESAAVASSVGAAWTWRLDRIWHIAETHCPSAIWEVRDARVHLARALSRAGPRVCRLAMVSFVARPVRLAIAERSRHLEVVRSLLHGPSSWEFWHLIRANPYVCRALREAVTASAYTWLAGLPAGLREGSPDHARRCATVTPEIHCALDVVEKDPRLADRDPAALGPALVHGDAAARERVAALLGALGVS